MEIRVPATSANLGPGFDCLGIAWQLYDTVDFSESDRVKVLGCEPRYAGPDNLACRAFLLAAREGGITPKGIRVEFSKTDIPVARGLGSSAALTVAGVLAADRLLRLRMTADDALRISAKLEGHPDNAAPALLGGMTSCCTEEGRVLCVPCAVHPGLCFTALIPDTPLSTVKARAVLPEIVPREDAVYNVSHTALLLHAMREGDTRLLRHAMRDRLHQPYRAPLIPLRDTAAALADRHGAAFCASGAGPTMLCASASPAEAECLRAEARTLFPAWSILPLVPEPTGAFARYSNDRRNI